MSDRIETVIAEAIRKHVVVAGDDPMLDVATDVLAALKAARIECVELPSPTYGPDGEGQFGWKPAVSSVTATPNDDGSWSIWDEDFDMTPDDARELGAALLAAAEVADAGARITVEEA